MTAELCTISTIAAKLDNLQGDMSEMKASIRELATAVARLALVEERQSNANEALTRAFKELDRHDRRLNVIEQAQPLQKHSSNIVQNAVAMILAAVLGGTVAGVFRGPVTDKITVSAPKGN